MMEKIFVHKPTGSTLYIKGTKWDRTFTLDSRWPKAEEAMVYLMCKAFGFGIEVERAMRNKNLDKLEKRLVILERQIESLSQHILELAKCDNFNSDLILDLRKRVETLEKGGE